MKNIDCLLDRAAKLIPRNMLDTLTGIEYNNRRLSFNELLQLRHGRRKAKGM